MVDLEIGVDIENINKFDNMNISTHSKFLTKIFSNKEIEYCFQKINPTQHLASRFAAKEAVIKTQNFGSIIDLELNEIEIYNNKEGKPFVNIKNRKYSNMEILITLSHNNDNAIAFAVLLNNQEAKHE